MTAPRTRAEIVRHFADHDLSPEMRWYLEYNARRYASLLEVAERLLAQRRAASPGLRPRVLDVAISFQTALLATLVADGRVDDIGYAEGAFAGLRPGEHIEFDLNDARLRERWPPLEGYDLVVMSETIEHLYIGPGPILGMLGSALAPGGFLVVQTPNAVALHKRLRMLFGRPPVGPLGEDRVGETHLHEYDVDELVAGGRRAGLTPVDVAGENYFGTGRGAAAYAVLGRMLPRNLRHGLTAVFRNDRGAGRA